MIDALLTLARNDNGLTRSDEPIDLAASGAERTALGNLPQLVLPHSRHRLTTPEQQGAISEATGRIVVR